MLRATLLCLAALCLITVNAATAITRPSGLLNLVDGASKPVTVADEPKRPEWPAQYQVCAQPRCLRNDVLVTTQLACRAL